MCDKTPLCACLLPGSTGAPSAARFCAQESLCLDHGGDAEAAVTLLASEMATDAILAGGQPLSMTVECQTSQIVVVVSSETAVRPAAAASQEAEDAHRRLSALLIDKVSREWGMLSDQDVTRRWCAVPTGSVPVREPWAWRPAPPRLDAEPPRVGG